MSENSNTNRNLPSHIHPTDLTEPVKFNDIDVGGMYYVVEYPEGGSYRLYYVQVTDKQTNESPSVTANVLHWHRASENRWEDGGGDDIEPTENQINDDNESPRYKFYKSYALTKGGRRRKTRRCRKNRRVSRRRHG